MNRSLLLWITILAGPLAWFASMEIDFALVPRSCISQTKLPLYLVTLVGVLIPIGTAMIARRLHSELPPEGSGIPGSIGGRSRAMAGAGFILSVSFAIVILTLMVPNVILPRCT